jgi:hypothetical protein
MPAVDTPSIAQQRIMLVVFLVVIAAMVWWQNAGGSSDYPVAKFSQTHAPDVFDEFDFATAEAAWSALQIDSQGNLQIDALTETALIDAMALMDGQAAELQIARMAVLLEKQFGATASQQILALLPILKNYKEAEQRWWAENGSRNPPPHAELFELQDELLGETLAEKMFSEQRRLVNMMLATQKIRADASLSQTEKDQTLMDLRRTVQQEGASIE